MRRVPLACLSLAEYHPLCSARIRPIASLNLIHGMVVMDVGNGDQDVMRIWSLLTEVSEQLTQNRSLSVSLHSLTGGIKVNARPTK